MRLSRNAKSPLLWLLALPLGCVGPLVDDAVPRTSTLRASVDDVPELPKEMAEQIDLHDQAERVLERRSGFAAGKRVWYWDLGPATPVTLPLYALVSKDADGKAVPIAEHPYLIDSIPGNPGYSPFWSVKYVPVTAAYDGEAIDSVTALQEARAAGLVGEPEETGLFGDCAVVHPDVEVETKDGLVQPGRAFYRGVQVPIYGFGNFEAAEYGTAPVADVVRLRIEGGEPLDEGVRHVDMTGDDDTSDSNNLFETTDGKITTPLWRVVTAAVPTGTSTIDTTNDEKTSDLMSYDDLFDESVDDTVSPKERVVAFEATAVLVNCPIEVSAP